MKIVKNYLTKNKCYRAGQTITVKGLMLHSTGTPQPKASAYMENYNKTYQGVCVHGFIDGNDGTPYQTLPWNYRASHCGSGVNGSANNTHIGVEMCEPSTIKYVGGATFKDNNPAKTKEVVMRTYKTAVELFAYLCKQYGLNPLGNGVIISHSEGHRRGIASNHGDVEHLWSKFGLTMDQFRKDVKAKMNGDSAVSDNSGSSSTLPYMIKVSIDDLNIRKGPGTNYDVTGDFTGVGAFTIVDEADGPGASKWGKLKSGAGWISLDYAKKV